MLVWYHVKFRIHKHDWLDVFARNAAFASKHKPECHHLHQISHGSLGRQCQHWWKDAPQSQIGSEILGLDCRSEAWKVNFFLKWNNTAKEQKLTGNRLTCRVWNQNQKVCWNIAVGQKRYRQVIILLWIWVHKLATEVQCAPQTTVKDKRLSLSLSFRVLISSAMQSMQFVNQWKLEAEQCVPQTTVKDKRLSFRVLIPSAIQSMRLLISEAEQSLMMPRSGGEGSA
jgi:hypothetical protein